MYKRKSISKLGRKTSHRNLMVRNLLTSLIKTGYVTTTTNRAKVMKQEFGTLLAVAKGKDSLHAVRMLTSALNNREIVDMLIEYAKKESTGINIVKVGFRPGDNTEKSKISLIGFEAKKKVVKLKKEAKKEEKSVEKVETKPVKQTRKNNLGKAIKETFTGRKERTRTRSGL